MSFEFTSDSEQETEWLNKLELASISRPCSMAQNLHKLCLCATINTNVQDFL